MKTIAVLMTCHNRVEKTMRCLTALHEAVVPDGFMFEVFLVDDASTDGTSERVKTAFPDINLIQGDGNLYWNRGMIKAWETAALSKDWDYYLWLNDDTYVFKEFFKILLDASQRRENAAVVCGSTISEIDGSVTYGGRIIGKALDHPNGFEAVCDLINGNCVLVPSSVYETVGTLDPVFPHAIGDFDYGLRAKKHGFERVVVSSPVGFCENNQELPLWCRPETPFLKRCKNLYSPLGNSQPIAFFIYEKRHFGFLLAIKHFVSIHLRLCIPRLWTGRN